MAGRLRGSLYGRRKGKPLSRSQLVMMDELWPKLRLNLTGNGKLQPKTLFDPVMESCWLEIGFGGGEHMIHLLKSHENVGMIGCEPYLNGIVKTVRSIESEGLADRVQLYDNDAALLLDCLETGSLSRVYMLYPDPWPKKKHRKRRFVSQSNLIKLARVMKPGAKLRIASDIDSYIDWTLNKIHACSEFEWTANQSKDWNCPWPGWYSTRYEAKAIREGRKPAYLEFRRK